MDERDKQQGIRSVREGKSKDESQSAGPQVELSKDEGQDQKGPGDNAQLRQSEVCEPPALESWDPIPKHAGYDGEGKTERTADQNALPKGTSEKDLSERPEILPVVREPSEKKAPVAIEADQDGRFVGSNIDQEYRLAKAYHMSGLMPKGLGSPEKVLVALQICRELKLPAMTSVGNIAVINGTPSLFGNLPLALVKRSGQLELIEEVINEDDPENMFASCTIKRKGSLSIIRHFSWNDAKRAGLFKNDVWSKYPKRMLQMRARGWAIKDSFPDVLLGLAQAEYDFNTVVENGKAVGIEEKSPTMQKLESMMIKPEVKNEGSV